MCLEKRFNSVSLHGSRVTGYFSTSSQGWTYVTAMPSAQFYGRLPTAVLQVSLGALALLGVAGRQPVVTATGDAGSTAPPVAPAQPARTALPVRVC